MADSRLIGTSRSSFRDVTSQDESPSSTNQLPAAWFRVLPVNQSANRPAASFQLRRPNHFRPVNLGKQSCLFHRTVLGQTYIRHIPVVQPTLTLVESNRGESLDSANDESFFSVTTDSVVEPPHFHQLSSGQEVSSSRELVVRSSPTSVDPIININRRPHRVDEFLSQLLNQFSTNAISYGSTVSQSIHVLNHPLVSSSRDLVVHSSTSSVDPFISINQRPHRVTEFVSQLINQFSTNAISYGSTVNQIIHVLNHPFARFVFHVLARHQQRSSNQSIIFYTIGPQNRGQSFALTVNGFPEATSTVTFIWNLNAPQLARHHQAARIQSYLFNTHESYEGVIGLGFTFNLVIYQDAMSQSSDQNLVQTSAPPDSYATRSSVRITEIESEDVNWLQENSPRQFSSSTAIDDATMSPAEPPHSNLPPAPKQPHVLQVYDSVGAAFSRLNLTSPRDVVTQSSDHNLIHTSATPDSYIAQSSVRITEIESEEVNWFQENNPRLVSASTTIDDSSISTIERPLSNQASAPNQPHLSQARYSYKDAFSLENLILPQDAVTQSSDRNIEIQHEEVSQLQEINTRLGSAFVMHPSSYEPSPLNNEQVIAIHDNDAGQPPPLSWRDYLTLIIVGVYVYTATPLWSIPYAVNESGWCGFFVLIIFGVLTFFTSLLIPLIVGESWNRTDYLSLGSAAWGQIGRRIGIGILCLFSYATCIDCVMVYRDNWALLYPQYPVILTCVKVLVMSVVVCFITIHDFNPWLASTGVFLSLFVVVFTLISGIDNGFDGKNQKYFNLQSMHMALGFFGYCFAGHPYMLKVYTSIRNKKNFVITLLIIYGISTALYAAMGAIGYSMFGEEVKSMITLNLPLDSYISVLAIYCTVFNHAIRFLSNLSSLATTVEGLLPDNDNNNLTSRIFIRFGFGMLSLLAIFITPYYGTFVSLSGSIIGVIVSLIVPAVCFLRIRREDMTMTQMTFCWLAILVGIITGGFTCTRSLFSIF